MSSIRARVHRSLQIAGFLLSISRIFVLFFSPPPIFLSVSLSLSFFRFGENRSLETDKRQRVVGNIRRERSCSTRGMIRDPFFS